MTRLVVMFRGQQKIFEVRAYAESIMPGVVLMPMFLGTDIKQMERYITVGFPRDAHIAAFIDQLEQRFDVEGYYREPLAEPAIEPEL